MIKPRWSEGMQRFDVNRFGLSVGAEVLASWLSDDVGSTNAALEYSRRLNEIKVTAFGGYFGSGNSFHVRVANGFVFIENQFLEDRCVLLKIDDTLFLLSQYKKFLEDGRRGQEYPPEAMSVSFEMEGPPAMDYYLSTGLPLGLNRCS